MAKLKKRELWTLVLESNSAGTKMTLEVNNFEIFTWGGMAMKDLTNLFTTISLLMQSLQLGGHLVPREG